MMKEDDVLKNSFDIPCIFETRGAVPEAVILLKVASLQNLNFTSAFNQDSKMKDANAQYLHGTRENLLRSLGGWGPEVTLEIRILMVPEIKMPIHGRCTIFLAIRTADPSEERCRELVLARYFELKNLLPVFWPEAEFEPITDIEEVRFLMAPFAIRHAAAIIRRQAKHTVSIPLPSIRSSKGGVFNRSEINFLQPFHPSLDGWDELVEVLSRQLEPVLMLIRLRSGSDPAPLMEQLRSDIDAAEMLLGRQIDHELPIDRALVPLRDLALSHMMQVASGAYDLGVMILSPSPISRSLLQVTGDAISTSKNLLQGGFGIKTINPDHANELDFFPEGMPFSLTESAAAFRLPSPQGESISCLPIKRSRTCLAEFVSDYKHDSNDLFIFNNQHRGFSQPISICADDLMSHAGIFGATNTGKTNLIETMVLGLIFKGCGVGVIDPHGDLIEGILQRIPEKRAEDVVLVDLDDKEYSIGFNPIQWSTIEERDLLIDEIYNTFDYTYDFAKTGGPIFEQNIRGMLKTLQGDEASRGKRGGYTPNLLDFTRCYTDSKFRGWLRKTISDPQVHQFVEELENTGGEVSLRNISPYITSKFSRLLHDNRIKRIIAQDTLFDFDDIVNGGKIFLVNLSKGRFGSIVSALLMNFFLSRFKLAAMKRGGLPVEERRDFYLFIDEAHNIPGENLSILLSEARKYRLSLTLATQYCAQIGTRIGNSDNSLLSAVLGNVGSIIMFRLGIEDAQRMSPVLYPKFTPIDVVNMPNYEGFARISGTSMLPFSFRTEPVKTPKDSKLKERIRNLSQEKYGRRAEDVEKMIQARAAFIAG